MLGFISRTKRVSPDSFTNLKSTGESPQNKKERHVNPAATGVKEPKSPSSSPVTGSDRRSKATSAINPKSRLTYLINRCQRSLLHLLQSFLASTFRHWACRPSSTISYYRSSIGRRLRFFHVIRIFGFSAILRHFQSSKATLCAYNHQ